MYELLKIDRVCRDEMLMYWPVEIKMDSQPNILITIKGESRREFHAVQQKLQQW